jgi:hypothetical protein
MWRLAVNTGVGEANPGIRKLTLAVCELRVAESRRFWRTALTIGYWSSPQVAKKKGGRIGRNGNKVCIVAESPTSFSCEVWIKDTDEKRKRPNRK